jgi:hypothetical protein
MARSYKKLFSIDILHDYYTSGKSHDFIIEPTSDTSKLAKGLRSVIKVQPSDRIPGNSASLSVSYEATDNVLYSEVTLSGTSGSAKINVNGIDYTATFTGGNLTATAANFVSVNGAALAAAGVTCTNNLAVLKFTPANQNVPFAVSISNFTPDLNGTVLNFTPTPLLPISSNERFRFAMKLNSPGFLTFTDLSVPVKNNKAEVYYFANGVGNVLTPVVIALRPKIFLYQFNNAGAVDELRIVDPGNNLLSELTTEISGAGPDYEVSLDLSNYPDGKYTLQIYDGSNVLLDSEEIYFDNQLNAGGIFGIIEITKNNNNMQAFRIEYAKSAAVWKYFVVVRDGVDPEDYSIDDDGGVSFITQAPTAAEQMTINALLNNLPDGEVVLFVGQSAIPYTEQKRKNVQLIKDINAVLTTVIIHLPNPSVQKASPDIFVYV